MKYNNNGLLVSASGRLGDIYFRQINGKTYASAMPRKRDPDRIPPGQRKGMDNVTHASRLVKEWLAKDPELKEKYKALAKKLHLPSSHSAALTDYLRKATIGKIRRSGLDSTTYPFITIRINKKGFPVREVRVTLVNSNGTTIEEGFAVVDEGLATYKVKEKIQDHEGVTIKVRLVDTDFAVLQAVSETGS